MGAALAACGDDPVQANTDAGTDVAQDAAADVATDPQNDTSDTSDVDVDTSVDRLEWPVTEPGPYNVGYRSIDVTYVPRGYTEERTLRTAIWYPTDATSGTVARYQNLLNRPDVFANATVADDGQPFPVMVFSHGNESFAEQNYFTTEFFATHGWVVIAPDHSGNTTFGSEEFREDIFILRPLDVSAMLDHLEGLPADDPLFGRLSDEAIVSGHSYGGYTSLCIAGSGFDVAAFEAACALPDRDENLCAVIDNQDRLQLLRDGFADSRFAATIPLTPGIFRFFGDHLDAISLPTMIMTGVLDETLLEADEGDPIWDAIVHESALRLDFPRAGHFTFSNMCDALPGFIDGDGCGEEFIPPPDAQFLINAYTMAFARFHLWDDQSVAGLLDGTESLSEEAQLEVR